MRKATRVTRTDLNEQQQDDIVRYCAATPNQVDWVFQRNILCLPVSCFSVCGKSNVDASSNLGYHKSTVWGMNILAHLY